MIQAEKLRKGNYIRTEPRSEANYYKVLKVDGIMGSVSAQQYDAAKAGTPANENINLNCCFPIDITSEILSNSGFAQTGPYSHSKEGLFLQFERYGEVYLHNEDRDITVRVLGINELQNEFLSITGKELEIKLS